MKIFSSGLDPTDKDDEPLPTPDVLGAPETILVVEDEQLLRGLIAAALSQFGYQVLTAADGEAAIEIASKHAAPIHLVISDVMMPRMNGIELVRGLIAAALSQFGYQVL